MGAQLTERGFTSMLLKDGRLAGFDLGPGETADAEVVDLNGGWVLPGLVDAHVHLELTAAPDPFEHWHAPLPQRMAALLRNGFAALASGILAVRDLGSVDTAVIDYGRMTSAGRVLGPRVVAAGKPVAMTGGHLWRYAREADGPSEVRRAVREQIRAGATVIKVMATGGLTTPGEPGSPELGEDELAAAVAEARNAGLKVAAHAHGPEGIQAAVRAGVATVEHGGLAGAEERAALLEAGVTLVPTLSPVLRLPADGGVAEDVVTKTYGIRPDYVSNIASAIREGVSIAAGTDAGCAYNPIGGVAEEIEAYVALGMDPEAAVRSATVDAARAIGLDGGGVLEEGAPADMVVLDGDPRRDPGLLKTPGRVVRAGQVLERSTLETIVAALGGRDADRPMANAATLLQEGQAK
jgi:imidazolonepropionase-like amidohydrolase